MLLKEFASTAAPPSVINLGIVTLVDGSVARLNLGLTTLTGWKARWVSRAVVAGCLILPLVVLFLVGRAKNAAESRKRDEVERRMAEIRSKLPPETERPAIKPAPVVEPVVEQTVEVEAWTIQRAYQKNPVDAEERWRGKKVRIRGKVVEIASVGSMADISISDDGTRQYLAIARVGRVEASNLKSNQEVVIIGRVRTIGSGIITVDDCRLE